MNLTIPVIFNQFVNSLSSFRFLDLTALLPNSIVNEIQSASPNYLDAVGPPKAIYYEGGINFYENMIIACLSYTLMMVINFIL